ncbi:unnamed protein product [Coccothraustes coccothraustes]
MRRKAQCARSRVFFSERRREREPLRREEQRHTTVGFSLQLSYCVKTRKRASHKDAQNKSHRRDMEIFERPPTAAFRQKQHSGTERIRRKAQCPQSRFFFSNTGREQ